MIIKNRVIKQKFKIKNNLAKKTFLILKQNIKLLEKKKKSKIIFKTPYLFKGRKLTMNYFLTFFKILSRKKRMDR